MAESVTPKKANSEDSLLIIYILRIIKKYSSPKNPLSTHDVMEYLDKIYSIGIKDKVEVQRKRVRRHLDTLCEFYEGGCIKKVEGKTRDGHRWYYDVIRDKSDKEEGVYCNLLTEVEAEFLIDLVLASKVINSEGTRGIVDKLLRETSLSDEDRTQKLASIQKEAWLKSPNLDLIEKKAFIEDCFGDGYLIFDYEDEESVTAIPLGWSYCDGICYLDAMVGDKKRKFSLDKIRNFDSDSDEYEEAEDFRRYDEGADSYKTALDSLFVNIPTIKDAINSRKCIRFFYRSYAIENDRVFFTEEEKSVLPHSLVFNDGKYYLIGIDEDGPELDKVAYFRVDLMFEVYCADVNFELSHWDKHLFDSIERARAVEKHPLMLAGKDMPITFKVVESAINNVAETFAVKADEFSVTKETRPVKDSSTEGFHEERVVVAKVRTTKEEAFRWALANADVVELVEPQKIRDRIARLAEPIHQLYTQSLPDKVRENIDYVLKEGTFKISCMVDEDTACQTHKELSKQGKLDVVDNMGIAGDGAFDGVDYFGDFINTKRLIILAPQIKNMDWAAKLVNVQTLKMTSSQMEDASWMKEMKKIRQLILTESAFSDLSVLHEHKEIDILDIGGTNVSDIGFIKNFPKLTQLIIANCPIDDYSPLFTTQSQLKYLEIDKKALEKIGEEKIRDRHIGIFIKVTNNSPLWYI